MLNIIIVLILLFIYLLIQSRSNKSNEANSESDNRKKEQEKQKKIPFVTEACDIAEGIREGYAEAKKILKEADKKTNDQNDESEAYETRKAEDIEFTFSLNEEDDAEIIDALTDQDDMSEYIKKLVRNDLDK